MKVIGIFLLLNLVIFYLFLGGDLGKDGLLFWLAGGPILVLLVLALGGKRKIKTIDEETLPVEGVSDSVQDGRGDDRSQGASNKGVPYVSELARYYRDFLETGFHKRREPKRAIRYRHQKNYLLGFNAQKYEPFLNQLWTAILQGFSSTQELAITKGKFVAKAPSQLQKLMVKQIEELKEDSIKEIETKAISAIHKGADTNTLRPQDAYDCALAEISILLRESLVTPFLASVSEALVSQPSWDQDIFEVVEDSLTEALFFPLREEIPELVNSVLAGECLDVQARFAGLFNLETVKNTVTHFFDDLSLKDLYLEIQELMRNERLLEEQEIYLYFCDISFRKNKYPVFYIPVHLEKIKEAIHVTFDSTAYINKKAIDYIVQEFKTIREKTGAPDQISDRIIYLEGEREGVADKIQNILIDLLDFFELPHDIRVAKVGHQTAKGPGVSVSNACHICIFDKSDEAIINDYEEILEGLKTPAHVSGSLFSSFVTRFIEEDPVSVNEEVERDWEALDTTSKLVYRSPIPLNEEQRKILSALKRKECNFIAVQGPPGTGKSHTITALLCDAILRGESILVLSDKKEALDVVESKATEVINSIRPGDDFQNPILRLGKSGNTYTKILSPAAMGGIEEQYRASLRNEEEREGHILGIQTELNDYLKALCAGYERVNAGNLEEFFALEQAVRDKNLLVCDADEMTGKIDGIESLKSLKQQVAWLNLTFGSQGTTLNLEKVLRELEVVGMTRDVIDAFIAYVEVVILLELELGAEDKKGKWLKDLSLFRRFQTSQIGVLEQQLRECDELKKMLFANVRRREEIRKLTESFLNVFSTDMRHSILDNYDTLNAAYDVFQKALKKKPEQAGGTGAGLDYLRTMHWFLVEPGAVFKQIDVSALKKFLKALDEFEQNFPITFRGLGIRKDEGRSYFVNALASLNDADFQDLLRYLSLHGELKSLFEALPKLDFLRHKKRLERLVTEAMAHGMDGKAVKFFHESKATAQTLRGILSKKQKFPREDFQKLKSAFPCIIAGIRDFSDYIPLEVGLFDNVIIDEASQVSVAQALPAIVRGKKVIVLGDTKQFSNLQSGMAKSEINQEYIKRLEDVFTQTTKGGVSRLERIKKLNIKTSILELFESISNFQMTLLKHSRGYREHISYSSKHFYNGRLQALKMRVKPIDEVLKFTFAGHDGKPERIKNTNQSEIDVITSELKKLKKDGSGGSIGIITPFHDQQTRLIDEINTLPDREYFFEQRKLKVMTFDTCQGEERDTIFYSLVATRIEDKLKYMFPRELNLSFYEEEGKVKVQRLNVGFSRAKECMHFVVSKPLEEFKGAIGGALFHFWNLSEGGRRGPEAEEPEAAMSMEPSMEPPVLEWIKNTDFVRKNMSSVEVKARFPIGEYLKQLDKTYEHPTYRADFLLWYQDPSGQEFKIIIEYDGFHLFAKGQQHDEWSRKEYYSAKDVEREKTLESYGYKFLRLNRFNVGRDPVGTIDRRLAESVGSSSVVETRVGV